MATPASSPPGFSVHALRDSETLLNALRRSGFCCPFGVPAPALWRYGRWYERQFSRKAVGSWHPTYCFMEPVGGLEPPTY